MTDSAPSVTDRTGTDRDSALGRYSRQTLFAPIGAEGQRRLLASRVVLIGCGALGSVSANTLVRAGVGHLRICDRDFIEPDNLQRQVLFDERDIEANLPKAQAAAGKLAAVNSQVTVEPVVADVNFRNIERLAEGANLILDGTDNFETRFLINDFAVKHGLPWIYGAVIGASGLCMTIIPNQTPCLRCVFEAAPPPQFNPTCDTAGVIAPAVQVIASLQAAEAIKILIGKRDAINRHLVSVDVWSGRFINLNVAASPAQGSCPCCTERHFPYLTGELAGQSTTLCGRNAVQLNPGAGTTLDLMTMAEKLRRGGAASARYNEFMLKTTVEGCELTLFPDGRAIISGTDDPDRARTLYARFVGA